MVAKTPLKKKARKQRPKYQAPTAAKRAARRKQQTKSAKKPWAESYLEERAVTVEFAEANDVKLGKDRVVFVKTHPLSNAPLDSSRTRHEKPPLDKHGKPMKFTQKRGESFPYFPKHWDWKEIFADPSFEIYIVESECSALAAAQREFIAIAVGGCDGAFMAGTHRQKLHPIFSEMVLKGREVFIVFDGDSNTNDNVHNAEQATAKLFAEAVR